MGETDDTKQRDEFHMFTMAMVFEGETSMRNDDVSWKRSSLMLLFCFEHH